MGLERELSGKPAGLRTNILICLGSALLMDLSMSVPMRNGTLIGDPARIAAQVVTGIGFLGAGTILQARGVVLGLTTAATIWVVAAIGLTIGAGHYVEAVGGTLLVALVLVGLGRVERELLSRRRVTSATIRTTPNTSLERLRELLRTHGIAVQTHQRYDHPMDTTYELKIVGPTKQLDFAAVELLKHDEIISVQID